MRVAIRINKTWLSWNGKRARLKSFKHCNRRKGRNQRKRSKSIHSRNPARLGFRGWALARALGRLELAI